MDSVRTSFHGPVFWPRAVHCIVYYSNASVEDSCHADGCLSIVRFPLARKWQCEDELTAGGRRHSRVWYSFFWLQCRFAGLVHSQRY